ncbi:MULTISPECIES: hypothetical protein [Bacillaceae]|uniref:Uncharacterized protein n=1 Tax=Evansella alkalicola TaxID=745819 RepID=A0ABS6JY95_9BACI|nr:MULTISPECIES: hypothetical protein [Bacillaceae]MBU9723560.1 hypothetical protein [Bacillus alkalicola]
MKKRHEDELDKVLHTMDAESHWNEDHRQQLKKNILNDVDKKQRSPFFKGKLNVSYLLSLGAVAVITWILFVPMLSDWWRDSDGLTSPIPTGEETETGFAPFITEEGLELILKQENVDEGEEQQFTLKIENSGPNSYEFNEVFLEKKIDWESNESENVEFSDRSIQLGELDFLDTGETTAISFSIPEEYEVGENYELMFHARMRDNEAPLDTLFFHFDLDSELITLTKSELVINNRSMSPLTYGGITFIILSLIGCFFIKSAKGRSVFMIALGLALFLGYVANQQMGDADEMIIEDMSTYPYQQPLRNVVHIEYLDNRHAIAFYEWGAGTLRSFENVTYKKGVFGWKANGGTGGQIVVDDKLGWSFSNLEHQNFSQYTDLISGVIMSPDIVEVRVTSINENVYTADIVEFNGGRFWFLVTDGDDVSFATKTGLNEDGEVVEEHHSRAN